MINLTFSIIQVAQAHEEGATSVTPDNIAGPFLALIVIILAVVAARRIKKINPVRNSEGSQRKISNGVKITTNKYD